MTSVEQDDLVFRIKAARQVQRSATDEIYRHVGESSAYPEFLGHTSSFVKACRGELPLRPGNYAGAVPRMQRGGFAPPRKVM